MFGKIVFLFFYRFGFSYFPLRIWLKCFQVPTQQNFAEKYSQTVLRLHLRTEPSIWSIFHGHIFLSRSNMLRVFKGFSFIHIRYLHGAFSYEQFFLNEKADDKALAIKGNNEKSFFAWPPSNEWVFMDSCIIQFIDFYFHRNSFLLLLFHCEKSLQSSTRKSFPGKILVTDCCCWMFHWPFAWLSPSFFSLSHFLVFAHQQTYVCVCTSSYYPPLVFHIIISDLIYIYWEIMVHMKRHKAKVVQELLRNRKRG